MRSTVSKLWVAASALLLALAWGCNGGTDAGPSDSGTATTGGGPTLTIQGYAFSPAELTVDAGTTIRIVNRDSMAHTVTSEAKDNDFVPGAVAGVSFDTGPVQPTADPGGGGPYGGGYVRGATTGASITIPASAPSGTVIPYFCSTHTSTMATPNGHITVR